MMKVNDEHFTLTTTCGKTFQVFQIDSKLHWIEPGRNVAGLGGSHEANQVGDRVFTPYPSHGFIVKSFIIIYSSFFFSKNNVSGKQSGGKRRSFSRRLYHAEDERCGRHYAAVKLGRLYVNGLIPSKLKHARIITRFVLC
jgi:hypothetical protein